MLGLIGEKSKKWWGPLHDAWKKEEEKMGYIVINKANGAITDLSAEDIPSTSSPVLTNEHMLRSYIASLSFDVRRTREKLRPARNELAELERRLERTERKLRVAKHEMEVRYESRKKDQGIVQGLSKEEQR